jgi:hypothetical protein
MPANAILSSAEFASLQIVGKGPFPVTAISRGHSDKLAQLEFIAAVPGGFETTSMGRFRIAVGS